MLNFGLQPSQDHCRSPWRVLAAYASWKCHVNLVQPKAPYHLLSIEELTATVQSLDIGELSCDHHTRGASRRSQQSHFSFIPCPIRNIWALSWPMWCLASVLLKNNWTPQKAAKMWEQISMITSCLALTAEVGFRIARCTSPLQTGRQETLHHGVSFLAVVSSKKSRQECSRHRASLTALNSGPVSFVAICTNCHFLLHRFL